MFNLQGSELIIIVLLALVVLGPEKLPDAMRKAGQMYAELKKLSSGFQKEFRDAIDEPVKEMRNTANLLRDSADFRTLKNGERAEKPKSAEMGSADDLAPADPDATPTDEVPFAPGAPSEVEASDPAPGKAFDSAIRSSDPPIRQPADPPPDPPPPFAASAPHEPVQVDDVDHVDADGDDAETQE